jgi:hypothetical protein
VNGDVGYHDIEAVRGEGQFSHVGRVQLDTIGYAFRRRISLSRINRIAGLILALPQVDAHGTSCRQSLRGGEEHGTAPAPKVEYSFIAAQVEIIQQLRPDEEFSTARCMKTEPEKRENRRRADERSSTPCHKAERDVSGDEKSGEREQSWRVYPVTPLARLESRLSGHRKWRETAERPITSLCQS